MAKQSPQVALHPASRAFLKPLMKKERLRRSCQVFTEHAQVVAQTQFRTQAEFALFIRYRHQGVQTRQRLQHMRAVVAFDIEKRISSFYCKEEGA